ncbi:2556_t:CDS:1 [Paraglomus brasilianum]|uniref:2556_t:CDS:1 n=1 Tax=Paraglomus brasilianum TaxID=144538 RepID=A0A9N9GNX2_9GLOM|nr:2556_t:CDS:1 [Paraglomus brasilianum]
MYLEPSLEYGHPDIIPTMKEQSTLWLEDEKTATWWQDSSRNESEHSSATTRSNGRWNASMSTCPSTAPEEPNSEPMGTGCYIYPSSIDQPILTTEQYMDLATFLIPSETKEKSSLNATSTNASTYGEMSESISGRYNHNEQWHYSSTLPLTPTDGTHQPHSLHHLHHTHQETIDQSLHPPTMTIPTWMIPMLMTTVTTTTATVTPDLSIPASSSHIEEAPLTMQSVLPQMQAQPQQSIPLKNQMNSTTSSVLVDSPVSSVTSSITKTNGMLPQQQNQEEDPITTMMMQFSNGEIEVLLQWLKQKEQHCTESMEETVLMTSENWSLSMIPAATTNQPDHQAQTMWSMNEPLCPKSPESDIWEIVVTSPDPSLIEISQSPEPLSPNSADLNYPHGDWNQSDSSSTTESHPISSPWDTDIMKTMSTEKTTLTTTTTWMKESDTIEKGRNEELVVEGEREEKSSKRSGIRGGVIEYSNVIEENVGVGWDVKKWKEEVKGFDLDYASPEEIEEMLKEAKEDLKGQFYDKKLAYKWGKEMDRKFHVAKIAWKVLGEHLRLKLVQTYRLYKGCEEDMEMDKITSRQLMRMSSSQVNKENKRRRTLKRLNSLQ